MQLSYYMEAVEQGNAGMWTEKPQYGLEDRDESEEKDYEQSAPPTQGRDTSTGARHRGDLEDGHCHMTINI